MRSVVQQAEKSCTLLPQTHSSQFPNRPSPAELAVRCETCRDGAPTGTMAAATVVDGESCRPPPLPGPPCLFALRAGSEAGGGHEDVDGEG